MMQARVRSVTLALVLLATVGGIAASPVGAVHSDTRPPTPRERSILIQIVRSYVESTC